MCQLTCSIFSFGRFVWKTNFCRRYCELKASDFTAWNCWRFWGYEISVNLSLSEPFSYFHLSLTYSCVTREEEKQISCFSFPFLHLISIRGRLLSAHGAVFIFIHIYLLKWAALWLYKREFSIHFSVPILIRCWKNLLSCYLVKNRDWFIEHTNMLVKVTADEISSKLW